MHFCFKAEEYTSECMQQKTLPQNSLTVLLLCVRDSVYMCVCNMFVVRLFDSHARSILNRRRGMQRVAGAVIDM